MSLKRKIFLLLVSIGLSIWIFYLIGSYEYTPSELTIEINAEYEQPDRLQLFWSYGEQGLFSEKNSKNIRLQGNKGIKKTQIKIPVRSAGKSINNIRFDISSIKNQEKIKIESIEIKSRINSIVLDKENFTSSLKINKYITLSKGSDSFILKTINNKYDPYVIFEKGFEIDKIIKKTTVFSLIERVLISILFCISLFYLLLFLPNKL